MSAFARSRGENRWLTGPTITTPELENWDANLFKALSDKGGVWNPTARLICGGAGWRIGMDGDLDDVRQLVMAGTAEVSFRAGKAVSRYLPLADGYASPFPNATDDAGWVLSAEDTAPPFWVSRDLGAPLVIPIRTHIGATIEGLVAQIGDNPFTHDDPPPVLSTLSIVRALVGESTTWETMALVQDVYVDQPTYDAAHTIELTAVEPIAVEDGYQYGAMLTAENGEFGVTATILQVLSSMLANVRVYNLSSFMT